MDMDEVVYWIWLWLGKSVFGIVSQLLTSNTWQPQLSEGRRLFR